MALVINNRVRELTSTTGTGAVTLGGAVGGFQTFAAGIGNDNTTYYAISINTENEWEVGLGTLNADSSTLTRTTVLESSNSDSAVDFAAGSKEVFCTLPSEKAVYLDASGNQATGVVGKVEGTDFTGSVLVGHTTTGTLDAATNNTGVGIEALDAITSGDSNTCVGKSAGTGLNTGGGNTFVGHQAGQAISGGSNNTAIGKLAGGALNYSAHYNVLLGEDAGDNISSGDGNVVIGKADVPSATGDRQLSISGYDGTTTTQWIIGANDGNLEVTTNWNPSLSTTGKALVFGF